MHDYMILEVYIEKHTKKKRLFDFIYELCAFSRILCLFLWISRNIIINHWTFIHSITVIHFPQLEPGTFFKLSIYLSSWGWSYTTLTKSWSPLLDSTTSMAISPSTNMASPLPSKDGADLYTRRINVVIITLLSSNVLLELQILQLRGIVSS